MIGHIGLQTYQWNNNIRSVMLLVLYPAILAATIWGVIWVGYFSFATRSTSGGAFLAEVTQFTNALVISFLPAIITVCLIWFMIAFFTHTTMIRKLAKSHPVSRSDEPELYNLLENLCISTGMKMPHLEIIETHARNAFASGISENTYTVTVTRGLLQSLSKEEVEAVLAHELGHILHRDVRLLIISVIFVGMIGFFSQIVWSNFRFNLWFGRRRNGSFMLLLLVGIVLGIGYVATALTRFALSRQREYMADAEAVRLTKRPEAMMSALLRISGKDKIPEATDDIALMCIENSRRFLGLFSTHPPIEKRVRMLSETTNTPIPDISTGYRVMDKERFIAPAPQRDNWLTRSRAYRMHNNTKS